MASFSNLTNQICYLEGTTFPSWEGNTSLTAHVTFVDRLPVPFANLDKASRSSYTFGVNATCTNEEVRLNDFRPLKHEDYEWFTLITNDDYNENLKTYLKRTVVRAVLVKIEEIESSPSTGKKAKRSVCRSMGIRKVCVSNLI